MGNLREDAIRAITMIGSYEYWDNWLVKLPDGIDYIYEDEIIDDYLLAANGVKSMSELTLPMVEVYAKNGKTIKKLQAVHIVFSYDCDFHFLCYDDDGFCFVDVASKDCINGSENNVYEYFLKKLAKEFAFLKNYL